MEAHRSSRKEDNPKGGREVKKKVVTKKLTGAVDKIRRQRKG